MSPSPGGRTVRLVRRGLSLVVAGSALLPMALVVPLAGAQGPAHDVQSVFFVAKSENNNQVHYGIHLDESCAPVGPAPVFAYWRMRERGPFAVEPLLARENRAYGIAEQRVLAHEERGGRVRISLHALPGRPIVVESSGAGGTCSASATVTIDGAPALLTSVFAQLRWPFGVEYLMLHGHSVADGRALQEKLPD